MYSVQSVADLSKRHSGNMSVSAASMFGILWQRWSFQRKFSRSCLPQERAKKKVTGFTSKAGNVFDTCLKFENDQISFDFDNPGEEEVQSTADDAPDETTINNTTMDEMGIPEEFLAGFDMAADSAQADDVSEAALAAAHELFGE